MNTCFVFYPNKKSWMTREVQCLLWERNTAFSSGNGVLRSTVGANLKSDIREATAAYKRSTEDCFNSKDIRMDRSCVRCLKTMVTFLNFICWLCGAFVVAFGEFQMINSSFASLIMSFWPVYPANTLVATGAIVTCVCYLGVLGGMNENRCMLITFFVLLFILMLVELAMACVFFVYSRVIDTYFERDLMTSLVIYRQSSPSGNLTIRNDFDAVHYLFKCCGVYGEADWMGNVPISCCTLDPCNAFPRPNWQEGCLVKLKNWFSRNYLSTGSGVVTMFIIQFICLCVNVPLFCHFSRRGLGYQ
ncbi:leukocyte surface antigen CD53-like [Thalassophryne amazonica]|uniref:leukocyte surface antigen CD53-like n=1 Tax=Thalassophryne amazonica TaxID=390379 RepID=UPI001471DFA1|nr:leukocyte surface antigen CD53-like [Thalassophryne amazonica]